MQKGSANAEGDVQKEQDLKAAMPYRKGSISLLQSQEPESPWQGVRSEVPPVNSCRFEPSPVLSPEHQIVAIPVF